MMRAVVMALALTAAVPALAGQEHQHMHDHAMAAPTATRTVAVTLGDMSFAPTKVEVKRGETIRFTLRNESTIDHDFTLGDAAAQAAHRQAMASGHAHAHGNGGANAVLVPAGGSGELVWTFDKAGDIEFACNVPGHYESGMKGVVAVGR
ncbi:MAG TPA: plastocyanin/azurin family copper-binding protein [Magnetospirillum sp.]|nr:plastocyanin/azurin family copper-binding protein [Magnetospirillum sp.]